MAAIVLFSVARGAKIAFFDVSGEEDASVLDVPYPDGKLVLT